MAIDSLAALRIKFEKVAAESTIDLLFRCPDCGATGVIDAEQALGLVSIQCPSEGCSYHRQGPVDPIIESRGPLGPDVRFTVGGQ